MYPVIHEILSDKKGGEIFTCFGPWHFCYIAFAVILIAAVFLAVRKKPAAVKEKVPSVFIGIAMGLYVLDFFLMPFAYGEIDIEKLPFHICTAMCVMCFVSRHVGFLEKYRIHFALLGFVSNLVYLIYPAGVMWHAVHPLCYRVVQTLLFHGIMTAYGFFALLYDRDRLSFRTCWRDLVTVSAMTVWAVIGNLLYTGSADGYSGDYNWFFVVRDPFGLFPADTAPFIMPFLNVAIFFAVEAVVVAVLTAFRRKEQQRVA